MEPDALRKAQNLSHRTDRFLTGAASCVRFQFRYAALISLLLLLSGGGCQIGPRNFTNENDKLRKQNLELEQQVSQLQTKLDGRLGELKALRSKYESEPAFVPGADTPVLSTIAFDRYTNAVDTNNDGSDDTLRVYLDTFDQNQRFIPVAGRAVLQAAVIEEDKEPFLVVNKTYGPNAVKNAYRSGMMGTHYSFEAKLPDDLPEATQEITVKLTFTDAATGATFTTQKGLRLE